MPVIVETLAQPSAQDRLDLAKIYADAPDWLFAPYTDGAALVAAGLVAGELIAGCFNDRLSGATLLRRGGDTWQLSHLCVRGITRGCGVGRRLLDEAWRLAAETGKPLRLVAPDGNLESLALAARHGLPLDSFRYARRWSQPRSFVMPFFTAERITLFALKGVGPTMLQRLEQMGLDDSARLRDSDTANILAQGATLTSPSCWKNSPQARTAIVAVLQRAASGA